MSWLTEHRSIFRLAFLLLFVVTLVGPWFYENDGVPPLEFCDERFVVVGDHCAALISGVTVIAWLPLAIASLPRVLFGGQGLALPGIAYILTLAALVIPFLSNLRHLVRDRARTASRSHRALLAIATLAGASWPVVMGYLGRPLVFPLFWGIWLYVATALLALAFELLLARRSPPSAAPQTVLPAME